MFSSVTRLKEDEFQLFRDLIYKCAGISLSESKRQLVEARLIKRLRYHDLDNFASYYSIVEAENGVGEETRALINCLTTNKTEFFRERHHFDFVSDTIVPEIAEQVRRGSRPRKLRVWHAGCSTGQEPYSNAMVLADALDQQGHWDVRLLASDIDTDVLATAQSGIYKSELVAPVPAMMREKHMKRLNARSDEMWQVSQRIKDMIKFRQINLLEEPWPIRTDVRFDLIFCRNVIIYFDKPTQRRLFERFFDKLTPGGYLLIGHSESLFGISESFQSIGGTVYRKPLENEAKLVGNSRSF